MLTTLTLALLLTAPLAPPAPVPSLWKTVDPETEARGAVRFLASVPWEDRPYIRLFSYYDVPEAGRDRFATLFALKLKFCTLSPDRRLAPAPVPGSRTLAWIDLRQWGWNAAAWRAVAARDKAFRQPWVLTPTAETLRGLVGELQPENYHCVAVVSALGLYRRLYETIETSDYYDLLFSEFRFPLLGADGKALRRNRDGSYEGKPGLEARDVLKYWPGGVAKDGKEYPRKWYPYPYKFERRGFRDFPADADEWLSAFLGGISAEEFRDAVRRLKSTRGAAVVGSENAGNGWFGPVGSFVARHDRLIHVQPILSGFGSILAQSFDYKKTAGKRDPQENAFTDQDRDRGRVFFDGQEWIVVLPNGIGFATLVSNGQRKRLESVPPDIAINSRDHHDRTVRNGPFACGLCHFPSYTWIPLNNALEKKLPNETDIHFKRIAAELWGKPHYVPDPEAAADYDAFFLGWQDALTGPRETFRAAWRRSTGSLAAGYKDGWTGIKLAEESYEWKKYYDAPVGLRGVVLETGAPEWVVRLAAADLTKLRQIDLARGDVVPRAAFDEDVFPELMKRLNSHRKAEIYYP